VVAALDNVDVVFLDLEMPGMDGYETHAWLRDRLKGVPIIAYTVHVSEMNVVKQRGFDGFLGKPLDNERFPGQLSRILAHEPVWERA
jgi:CheY-like chemotaxis protein